MVTADASPQRGTKPEQLGEVAKVSGTVREYLADLARLSARQMKWTAVEVCDGTQRSLLPCWHFNPLERGLGLTARLLQFWGEFIL
jgi:hypothetical protein